MPETIPTAVPPVPPEKSKEVPSSLEEMMKKQLEWSEKIFKQNKKIISHMRWAAFASILKIALFVVPFIIAAVYLQPLLTGYMEQYNQLMGAMNGSKTQSNSLDVESIMKQLQEFKK